MKTTGKIIGGIAIVIVLIALILCVAACIDSGNKTYEYKGKNVFVVGEEFDFENSKILKKDKDGKVVKTSKISKKDLYDFIGYGICHTFLHFLRQSICLSEAL